MTRFRVGDVVVVYDSAVEWRASGNIIVRDYFLKQKKRILINSCDPKDRRVACQMIVFYPSSHP